MQYDDIIKVFRLFRVLMHLSTRNIANLSSGEAKFSRSLVAAVEVGTRRPTLGFVLEYGRILQEKSGFKHDIFHIAETCAKDDDFMHLQEVYMAGKANFYDIYAMMSFILEQEDPQLLWA